jgi:glycosyltransferase involved in cell wall biosynthesis
MRLAVTTICPHVQAGGRWWSYEPFVREMAMWAELFSELVMVAPLDSPPVPPMWAPYPEGARVTVEPYRRDRGKGLRPEVTSPAELPRMVLALARAARRCDAVHVRCPGSIGLVAAALGPLLGRRRVAKYAGQWSAYAGEPRSFRLQRRLLRSGWWGAPVTVYGKQPGQPAHVVPAFSSALTDADMRRARQAAAARDGRPVERVLYVGRLARPKNVHVLIDALARLRREGVALRLTVAGDGPERAALEDQARAAGLTTAVEFAGAVGFDRLSELYAAADVLVLASATEGWPKALVEGMAFGVVGIGSRVGLIPQILADGRGLLVPPGDAPALATALAQLAADPEAVARLRARAAPWGQAYTLEALRELLRGVLATGWRLPPGALRAAPAVPDP